MLHSGGADAVPVARRRRGRVLDLLDRDWVFALSLAFAVGVTVWFGRAIKDFFAPSAVAVYVPSVVGQTQQDATAQCARLHLRCTVVASQSSDRFPKGVVSSQQPSAGTQVREGRQVSLIVSTGVTIFPMPDLRYESLRNAGLDLNRLKLQLDKTTYVTNDEIPRDHIATQDPAPLTSVRPGSKVALTLSRGPRGDVKVPNFTGMTIDEARDEAARDNIILGQVVWTPFGTSGPPRGTIVRQKPGPGSSIDPFESVSLQISAGPGEYGYLVRQVHVSATVPANDQTADVRMQVRDDTGTWNVYDGYAQGGQKLDFNLTVVGSATLETYVNNELLNQTQVGEEPARWIPTPSPRNAKNGAAAPGDANGPATPR
ncbi:MAG TPA: PASTA domain-containing protein [Candidatus Baltobacteraceae bacterium]|nr:PASTA domain-containing protein [Candidatus Baltobacteraceae bacterium]